jgi:lysophospholipase L1-like esterase
VGFLFGLGIAEISCRIFGYSFPNFYTPDAALGYTLVPQTEGWYRREGQTYVHINSEGLRDREHTKKKPSNTIRVAVLGDSYAEALQVPMEQTWWHLVEEKLHACLAPSNIEVLNFGVSGYGTAQELIMLRERVWAYDPDVVLLAFTTNNDVSDNLRALKKNPAIPYFRLQDGKLTLDDSYLNSTKYRWSNSRLTRFGRWIESHLRIVQALHQAMSTHNDMPNSLIVQAKPAGSQNPEALGDIGIDNAIYAAPRSPDWTEAWRVTEALLQEMDSEVRAHHTRFIVVTLSNGVQVIPNSEAREVFLKRVGGTDLFYPDQRVRELCERLGIPVITLAPILQSYAEQQHAFLHGFGKNIGNGHWNVLGHSVAAEALTPRLCELVKRQ